jgi:hypothetical protein
VTRESRKALPSAFADDDTELAARLRVLGTAIGAAGAPKPVDPVSTAPPRSAPAAETWTPLTIPVPQSLFDALRREAFEDHVTLKTVVLRALRKAGYEITEESLVDRRKFNGGKGRGDGL